MTTGTEATPLPSPALLFCPADRPDRYAKASAIADVVVLDLEDAVAPGNRDRARRSLTETPLDPSRVVVRINAAGTQDHRSDLAALRRTAYRTIMLAKTESPAQVKALADWRVVALCETPLGILRSEQIAAVPNIVAMMWGAEDFIVALGGRTSRRDDGRYRDIALHARATVLVAAKAHGRQAIDGVHTEIANTAALAAESRDAAESGFDLKACIHPSQVAVVRESYRPSPEQIEFARRVLEASSAGGVVSVDGTMIDGPIIAQAARIFSWRDR